MKPVRRAIGDGRIAVPDPWLLPVQSAPAEATGLVAVSDSGHCVFHQHDRCTIHRTLGHEALPAACQHFPRVCLIDPRGVFVTLSHFCPTAATLLFDERPVSVVEGPPALPDGAEPEGLDARGAWPPLQSERLLMDLEEYDRWERHMIDVLAGAHRESSPEAALSRLREDASARQARLRADVQDGMGADTSVLERFDRVRAAVPMPLTWPAAPSDLPREWTERAEPAWHAWAGVAQRFLAAHAFGSWLAYQGRGLRAIVRSLEAALAVLQVEIVRVCCARDAGLDRPSLHEAIRQADLLLRHYVDRQAFADAMSLQATAIISPRR